MISGVFQCAGGSLTPSQRLEKLAAVLGPKQLDLIVCPELFLSGYNMGESLKDFARTQSSAMVDQVAQIAREFNTAIVYSYPECTGEDIYNVAACVSAKGEVIAKHRKLMIPPGFETTVFTPGSHLTLFDLAGFRCGILICYDVEFPESVRALAQAGAQVVIAPTALYDNWEVVAMNVMPTRAFENGVWLLYANHAGEENGARYLGASCIIAPDGKEAARAGRDEQLIIAELTLERVVAAQTRLPYLPDVEQLKKRLIVPE